VARAAYPLGPIPLARPNRQQPFAPDPSDFVRDEVLVEFKAGVGEREKADMRGLVGGFKKEDLKSPERRRQERGTAQEGDLELIKLVSGLDALEAADRLRNHPFVKIAEPNLIYRTQTASNDPEYTAGNMWNMYGDTTTPANT
jgi:hypothetical protein